MRIGTVPIGRQQLLAHLMARLAQKLGAASHASAAALAIVALSFAAAPSLLPPTAWRLVLGMNGAVLLLLLPMEHVLAELRRRSEPTFPSPPCPPASEVFECPSCRKPCTGEHGFRIHLGHRPSCKRAWLARHIGRVAPAAPPVAKEPPSMPARRDDGRLAFVEQQQQLASRRCCTRTAQIVLKVEAVDECEELGLGVAIVDARAQEEGVRPLSHIALVVD